MDKIHANETIKQLYERKSVRVFEETEISEADKLAILTAATMAPTAGNQQLYTIINVTTPELKEKLSVICDNQPFISQAKLLLIFCADCQKWYDAYTYCKAEPRKPGVGDLLLSVDDAVIAAQNSVCAAESLGIGSCYIGDIMENCESLRDLINLPEYVFPAALLVFGYPTPQQKNRPKPQRVELSYIVHENTYNRLTDVKLEAMFSQKAGKEGYSEWMQAFCKRKYNSDFSREMTRSVGKYLASFEDGSKQ